MSEKRRGLGRGLGALIPSGPATKPAGDRPVDDVFFRDKSEGGPGVEAVGTATAILERPLTEEATSRAPTEDHTPPEDPAEASSEASDPAYGDGEHHPAVEGSVSDGALAEGEEQTDLVPVPGATFAEIAVESIQPNPRQPRQVFDDEELAELVHSVSEIGVLQPIVVRPAKDAADGATRYELIMGERRWRACQQAGLATIPAIVRETSDDALLRDALLENLHRSELNPLEEAAAYQQLLDDFGCTHEELATRIGRSRPQISNTIRLLRLPPLVQRRVAAGVLSAGHARALLGLEDTGSMEALAQRIVSEGLSVRAVEEVVALGDAPTVVAPQKKRPRPGSHRSELDDLASRLGDSFDTRVSITLGQRKGRLSIDFASVEDLNRILGLMVTDVRGAFDLGSGDEAPS